MTKERIEVFQFPKDANQGSNHPKGFINCDVFEKHLLVRESNGCCSSFLVEKLIQYILDGKGNRIEVSKPKLHWNKHPHIKLHGNYDLNNLNLETSCDGKIVEIDGKKYELKEVK